MNTVKRYRIFSRGKLVLFTALAITLFFALPRLAFLQRVDQPIRLTDFFLRTGYTFLVSMLFLFINLERQRVKLGARFINLGKPLHQVLVNAVLFVLLDFLLIRFHLTVSSPVVTEKLFRFLFHSNMALVVTLSILVARIYYLLFNNYEMRMFNQSLLKINAETRYEVLKNQMNPHFLFNSFNTINSLILSNKEAAMHFVNHMSDVFRYVLVNSNRDLIPLEEELRFLEAYVQMLKGRYGDKLQVTVAVEPKLLAGRLPPMALQVLVENAVKHNVVARNKPLQVRVFTRNNSLVVSNNLQKRKITEPSTGLGLHNLNQRCQHLSNHEIVIQRTTEVFSVTVPLMA